MPRTSRLRIDARRDAHGIVRSTCLVHHQELLALEEEGQTGPWLLPAGAVEAVFARYGRPLEEGVAVHTEEFLPIVPAAGGAAEVHRFQFQPFGWVQPADYLLLTGPGAAPLVAPAPLVAAALQALARAGR